MPNYDFYCITCNEHEEHHFGFHEDHTVVCSVCKNVMRKVMPKTGVIFRGTGWAGKSN